MASSDYVFRGAQIRYQANISANLYPDALKEAVRSQISQRVSAIRASLLGFSVSGDQGEYNVQVNLQSNQDRGSINDIAGDLGSALSSIGNLKIRAAAANFISNPRTDGVKQPGTIPGPIQGDTYHSGDTTLGVAGQYWSEEIGRQVQGLVKALSGGSSTMWLGIGVVALILFSRK